MTVVQTQEKLRLKRRKDMENRRKNRSLKLRTALFLIACAAMAFASGRPRVASSSAASPGYAGTTIGEVKAKGAFTADFGLPASLPLNEVAPLIERDRMYMSARRGMQNKYLPLRIDFATGNLLSGGRYLFDTEHDARQYKDWVEN